MPESSKPDRWRSLLESFGLAAPASPTENVASETTSAEPSPPVPVAAQPAAVQPVSMETVPATPAVEEIARPTAVAPLPPAKSKPKPAATVSPKRSNWSQLAGQLGLEVPEEPDPLPEPLAAMLSAPPMQQAPQVPQSNAQYAPPASAPVSSYSAPAQVAPAPAPVAPAPTAQPAAAARPKWEEDTDEFPAPAATSTPSTQEDFRGRRRQRGRGGRDRVRREEGSPDTSPRSAEPRSLEPRSSDPRDRSSNERPAMDRPVAPEHPRATEHPRSADAHRPSRPAPRELDYDDEEDEVEEVSTGAVIEYGLDDAPAAGPASPASDEAGDVRRRRRRRRGRGRRGRGGAEAPVSEGPAVGRPPIEDEELDDVLPRRSYPDRDELALPRGEFAGRDLASREFIDDEFEVVDPDSVDEVSAEHRGETTGEGRGRSSEDGEAGRRPRRRRRRRGGAGRTRDAAAAAPPAREARPAPSRVDDEDDDEDLDDVSYAGRSPRRPRTESADPRRAPQPSRGEPVARDRDDLDVDDLDHDHDDHDEGGEPLLHKKIPTWDDAVGSIVDGNIAARSSRPEHGGRGRRGGGRGGR